MTNSTVTPDRAPGCSRQHAGSGPGTRRAAGDDGVILWPAASGGGSPIGTSGTAQRPRPVPPPARCSPEDLFGFWQHPLYHLFTTRAC